jgi:hypothetical protein
MRVKTSTESISGCFKSWISKALFRLRGTGYTACCTVVAAALRRDTSMTCGRRRYFPCEYLDFGRHRCTEKQRLSVLRHRRHQAVDLRRKSHVEHAVSFVEDQDFQVVEAGVASLEMVDESARRRHNHVHARTQCLFLGLHPHAAVDGRHDERRMLRVLLETLLDLLAQLARGRQYQRAEPVRAGNQPVRDGERERRGLPRTRLREANDVAASQDQRDCRPLDRGGLRVA